MVSSSPATTKAKTPSKPVALSRETGTAGDSVVIVASHGDVVLRIEHNSPESQSHMFRVSSPALEERSKYFARLLQGRFGESGKVQKAREELEARYGNIADAPSKELPVIDIKDLGRISAVKSPEALCSDLLCILHGVNAPSTLPVANLANLAIVADRFDALEAVKVYVQRKKLIRAIDGKSTPKLEVALPEEKVRQRLLVAILLDYPQWMEKYSMRLITRGWVGKEALETDPLWWDMPARCEEEMLLRRDCILETIQSMQSHFISLYTSRDRQCKLGYDSSAQCDSFQLGEMLRFFTRVGTLQVKGTLLDISEPVPPYGDDVFALLDVLRQVPEYQIDKNHHHCGIRTRMLPLIDLLTASLPHAGICSECWSEDRMQHAWMDAKRPLLWKRQTFHLRSRGHRELHAYVQGLFTAAQRDWNP